MLTEIAKRVSIATWSKQLRKPAGKRMSRTKISHVLTQPLRLSRSTITLTSDDCVDDRYDMNALQATRLSSIYPNPRKRQARCSAELKPRPRWRPARQYRNAKTSIAYLAEQRVQHPTALSACLDVQIRRRDSKWAQVLDLLACRQAG